MGCCIQIHVGAPYSLQRSMAAGYAGLKGPGYICRFQEFLDHTYNVSKSYFAEKVTFNAKRGAKIFIASITDEQRTNPYGLQHEMMGMTDWEESTRIKDA